MATLVQFPPEPTFKPSEELALENEARIQLQLDGANVGLFEWDVLTNESRWSTGFYRLHGLEPGSGGSYELWRSQVHPDDIARVEAHMQQAIASADSVDTDYRIYTTAGELRWTLLQARIHRDSTGQPLRMTGYCGDITRRKLADAALLESEKLAIAGRMSAAIAHEINNPLEAVFNLIYLARGISSVPEQGDLLDQAIDQLRRVSEISQQTLKFSRPTKPRLVPVAEVVSATLHLLGPKLAIAHLTPIVEVRDDARLFCSPGELQQILTNILNNAAEATRLARTVRIRVRHACDRRGDDPTHGIRITIADSGPGMTPATRLRLREPFFTTKEGSGTGLGMWVVHELLTKLGGRMTLRSTTHPTHHGTVISLFFPNPTR